MFITWLISTIFIACTLAFARATAYTKPEPFRRIMRGCLAGSSGLPSRLLCNVGWSSCAPRCRPGPSAVAGHHDFLHVDAGDRLIDVLAGALKPPTPIVGMPQHPQPARLLVVPAQRIDNFPVRLNETRHPFLQLAQNDLRGRKDQKARRFACEL